MNYQKKSLPENVKYISSSPIMSEKTVLPGILHKHMAPKGMYGHLKVLQGKLQFVWEDTDETLDADPAHSIVIEPERYHHVKINGPVSFQVEFFKSNSPSCCCSVDKQAIRPGEQFIPHS